MNFRVILFSKLAILYCIITGIRNKMYDKGWKKSRSFSVKTICVGNLSLGGTGKSPMVEYIVRLLSANWKLATLSRGYKRKTKGFAEVRPDADFTETGDEPLQFKKKFAEIPVTVCEDRCNGIDEILHRHPETKIIILDDAYQHRKVKAGLNILLTGYSRLFTRDYVFPSGTLRESRSGAKRAHAVVVTKCPETLGHAERKKITEEIQRKVKCPVVFSKISYKPLKKLYDASELHMDSDPAHVLVFTGIAHPHPLKEYLDKVFGTTTLLRFRDHYEYSVTDLVRIQETFNNIAAEKKIIVTTEKDAVRLEAKELKNVLESLPVYVAAVETDFFPEDKITFNKILTDYAEHD